MDAQYINTTPLSLVQPAPQYFRVTFRGNGLASYATFQTVWDNLFNAGVVPVSARPSEAPQIAYGVVNVIDLHSRAATGSITVADLASRLDHLSAGADVVRIERLARSDAGDVGGIYDQQQTDQQHSARDPLTDPLANLGALLGKLGKGALIAGVLLLAIVVADKLPRLKGEK